MKTLLIILAIFFVGACIVETIDEKTALPEQVKVEMYEKAQAEKAAKEKESVEQKREDALRMKEGREIFEKTELLELTSLPEGDQQKVMYFVANEYVARVGSFLAVIALLTFIFIKFNNAKAGR